MIKILIDFFPLLIKAFEENCPFKKYGQLEYHTKTIRLRRELGSVKAALNDEIFQRSLYETLQAWGIGSRASILRSLPEFVTALKMKENEIIGFEQILIDHPDLKVAETVNKLSSLVLSLDIVENQAKLVSATKALHHLLPDLIVPIDRAYTQLFFDWQNHKFQYSQSKCFEEAFRSFTRVAREVNPEQYVGDGWNTSRTKVIDNAIVGLLSGGIELIRKTIS